jgi:hypothetical protein
MRFIRFYLALIIIVICIAPLFGAALTIKPEQGGTDVSYWEPVERAIGVNGTLLPGGVFKIGLTRSDVIVAIGDVRLKPAMAMDSWVSFMRMGDGAMMMGDLVLTADEIGPVQEKLSAEGIDITAIHNTLIGESPQVYDLHIGGQGDPVNMAKNVRKALDLIKASPGKEVSTIPSNFSLDYERLDIIIGHNGTMEDGVYTFEMPRAEKITEGGMEIPLTMETGSIIKFQPLGNGKAAIAGDLMLRGDEVNPVIRALNENGIMATALHTHMLAEEPRLFLLHFWATGDGPGLAKGLRAALDQTNSIKT